MSDSPSREEHEDVRRRLDTVEAGLKEQLDLLHKIDKQTDLNNQALVGNGTIGVVQRLGDIEEWIKARPAVCFLQKHIDETLETPKEAAGSRERVKVNAWNVVFGIGGLCGVVATIMAVFLHI